MQITKENIKLFQDAESASFMQNGFNNPLDGESSGKIKLNFQDTIRGQIVDSNIVLDTVDTWSNDYDKPCRLSQMRFENYTRVSLYSDTTAKTAFDSLKVGDYIRLKWLANYNTGLDVLLLQVTRGKKTLVFQLDQRLNNTGCTKMIKFDQVEAEVSSLD